MSDMLLSVKPIHFHLIVSVHVRHTSQCQTHPKAVSIHVRNAFRHFLVPCPSLISPDMSDTLLGARPLCFHLMVSIDVSDTPYTFPVHSCPSFLLPLPEALMIHCNHRKLDFNGTINHSWDSLLVKCQNRDLKVVSLNPSRSGRRIFFSRVNFVSWLLFGAHSIPALLQWHVKDPGHSAKRCRWQVTPRHPYVLDPTKSEWDDYTTVQA